MEADLQSFVAFYLTGKKQPARLDDIGGLKLRPALFSGYHDLTRMRYDFPLVLIEEPVGERFAEPLSGLIDTILGKVAQGPDGERIRPLSFGSVTIWSGSHTGSNRLNE